MPNDNPDRLNQDGSFTAVHDGVKKCLDECAQLNRHPLVHNYCMKKGNSDAEAFVARKCLPDTHPKDCFILDVRSS